MSYKDLLKHLNSMNADQLSQTVTVFDHTLQEFIPVEGAEFSSHLDDVLDPNHLFLKVTT